MSLATTEFLQKHGLDQDTTRNPLRPLDNLTNTPTRSVLTYNCPWFWNLIPERLDM